jgi:hypothetical protein
MLVKAAEVLGRVVFAGISLADTRDGSNHTSFRFFLAQLFLSSFVHFARFNFD